jgi:hypothetical protein
MIISETQKPPVGGMGGSVHDWERGLDPWHEEAFEGLPTPLGCTKGERKGGWFALDAYGNQIGFVADGEEYPDELPVPTPEPEPEPDPDPADTAAYEDLEQVHMAKDGLPMALWPKFPEGAITLWMAGDLIDAFPASIKEHCRAAELLGDGDLEAHRAYLNQFAREGYFEIFKDEMEWAYQREAARDYAASVVRDAPPRQGRRGDN